MTNRILCENLQSFIRSIPASTLLRVQVITMKCLFILPSILLLTQLLMANTLQARQSLNGFSIENPLVPLDQIQHGGPPKDGIPALDNPVFISAQRASELKPLDRVLGLKYQGEIKAYPIRILDHHEIVNDQFGSQNVVISFCPLCGTGMGFNARVNNQVLDFGVSGLLYNSDVLMYDRQTESLWSQIDQQAISGPMKGARLQPLPIEHTTWADWKARYPKTKVLSFNTGHSRNYRHSPYAGYESSESLYFTVSHQDKRYHPKEITLGLQVGDTFKAYPFSELGKGASPLSDTIEGKKFTIHFDMQTLSGRVENDAGQAYPVLSAYWFAWIAFHPDTQVYGLNPN
jgi:hypothetical protein